MGGKAKPTKHSAKEIAQKHHESKMKNGARGGGQDGIEKRTAPKEGKRDIFLKCEKCLLMQPSFKSMKLHYEGKHPKENWEEAQKLYEKKDEEDKVEVINGNLNDFEDDIDDEEEEKEVDN